MNSYQKIKHMLNSELVQIGNLKRKVEKSLKKAPEGSLVISKSNGVIQYFHKTDKTQKKGKYIEKKNEKLISALAQKDYDNIFYRELEKQEKQVKRILKNLPQIELTEMYSNLTEARKPFVNAYICSDEEYVKKWLAVEYTGKIYRDEYPKYTTERGEKVRSKSEKIIADKLYAMGIPYRYEYPVKTKGMGVIYPDFTILIVASRKEIYLEHFGMMDDQEYCEKALLKIQELARNGIVLGKNLFATFESSTVPLDIKSLEAIPI